MQHIIKLAVARNIDVLSDKIAELVVIAKHKYPDHICEINIKKYHNTLWLVSLIIN